MDVDLLKQHVETYEIQKSIRLLITTMFGACLKRIFKSKGHKKLFLVEKGTKRIERALDI